jgi:hypothetical protein
MPQITIFFVKIISSLTNFIFNVTKLAPNYRQVVSRLQTKADRLLRPDSALGAG